MTQPFLGQISQGGWNFAPQGYALCNGQTMSIQQNAALFALLGTFYGGNGTSTFQLPDLQGRQMVHWGNGLGLSPYVIGQRGGAENAQLNINNLPSHNHTFSGASSTLQASTTKATTLVPAAGSLIAHADDTSGKGSLPAIFIPSASSTAAVNLGGLNVAGTIAVAGGSQPFPIQSPYLAITCVIALTGIFPSRN